MFAGMWLCATDAPAVAKILPYSWWITELASTAK